MLRVRSGSHAIELAASAKLVDLDPQWQFSPQIWGLTVRVVDPGTCLGEISFLSRSKIKSAITISAVTDLTVAKVDPIELSRCSDKCVRRFSDAFLAAIAERLIASDTRLSEFLVERSITLF